MKKQFLFTAVIILIGICFCYTNENNPKACGTNMPACSVIQKKKTKNVTGEYVEDADASFNMFMNPFTRL
jgi:hypothetical protein